MMQDRAHVHNHASCCGVTRRRFLQTTALATSAALLPGSLLAQGAGAASGRRVDTHFHFYPPELVNELGSGVGKKWSPQVALDQMDKNGVASAVFSLSSVPEGWWRNDVQWMRKTTRLINDYAAKLVHDHPKRFGLWGFLSMADVDSSLKEIEYVLDTLKADGIGIATNYGDKWPGDPKFTPIFDELNRRKAVVYFHPNAPFCCGNLVPNVGNSWIEYPHDTTRSVLSLLFNGALAKHRDIKFLFSHGGGTIPMLAGRIESSTKRVKNLSTVAPKGVIAEFQRLHYDTANATSAPTMAAVMKLIPLSQIVFGSDFPYYTQTENIGGLQELGLSDAQLKAIYYENAYRLVPRLKA